VVSRVGQWQILPNMLPPLAPPKLPPLASRPNPRPRAKRGRVGSAFRPASLFRKPPSPRSMQVSCQKCKSEPVARDGVIHFRAQPPEAAPESFCCSRRAWCSRAVCASEYRTSMAWTWGTREPAVSSPGNHSLSSTQRRCCAWHPPFPSRPLEIRSSRSAVRSAANRNPPPPPPGHLRSRASGDRRPSTHYSSAAAAGVACIRSTRRLPAGFSMRMRVSDGLHE